MNYQKFLLISFHFLALQGSAGLDSKYSAEQSNNSVKHSEFNLLKEKLRTQAQKMHSLISGKIKSPILYSFRPTEIFSITDNSKASIDVLVAKFWQIAHKEPRDIRFLYGLMHHDDINRAMQDAKTFNELNTIRDAQGVSVFEHAVESNDAHFVRTFLPYLNPEERLTAFRYAAEKKRPYMMAVLQPKIAGESRNQALEKTFLTVPNFNANELSTFFAAQSLLREQNKHLFSAYSKISGFKDERSFPEEARFHIANFLCPECEERVEGNVCTIKTVMDPTLEKAIRTGETKKINELIQQSVSLIEPTEDGMDALTLSVHCAQPEVFSYLMKSVPYINENKKKELIAIAKQQKDQLQALRKDVAFKKDKAKKDAEIKQCAAENAEIIDREKRYDAIIEIIHNGLPRFVDEKNAGMIEAYNQQNHTDLIAGLKTGCNPNHVVGNNGLRAPIAYFSLNVDPVVLRALLHFKARTSFLIDNGRILSLARMAVEQNKPEHFHCLLESGNLGNDFYEAVLASENLFFLKSLIDHNAKFNNIRLNVPGEDIPRSFVWLAIKRNRLNHALLLLDSGATIAGDDEALAEIARNMNPQFMEMLLAYGLNPNTKVKGDDGKEHALLHDAFAKENVRLARLLLEAGASRKILCCAYLNSAQRFVLEARALLHDTPEFLEILIQHGLSPNERVLASNNKYYPLLEVTILKNKPHHAKVLLSAGADMYALDGTGKSILREVMNQADPLWLKMFLEHGLNPNASIVDGKGKKIALLDLAQGKPEHIKILKEAGAREMDPAENNRSSCAVS